MELITINRLELASNLALKQLCLKHSVQEDELFDTAENGDKNIKEYYRDEFNDLYDGYLDMINKCQEDREITPTRMAEIMKANLIEMALNDRLPQDLNELDINDLVGDMNFVFEEMPPVPEFFEPKRFPVEFEWEGEARSFDIHPTEPDWWISIKIEDDTFDIHYCEDYNSVCVYLVRENVPDFREVIKTIPIRKEESNG